MTKVEKRIKFFEDISTLVFWCSRTGYHFMPYHFHRTPEQQKIYRAKKLSLVQRSFHQDWLAIDMVLVVDGKLHWKQHEGYNYAGELWEKMGHTWGGRWTSLNDIYHFQWGNNVKQ